MTIRRARSRDRVNATDGAIADRTAAAIDRGGAGSVDLRRAVRRRTRARLRSLGRRLRVAGESAAAALLDDALASRGDAEWLFRGDVRALIASCESAIAILDLAAQARTASGARRDRAVERLFAEVAATAHLLDVAPHHRPDARFVARAGALGRRLLAEAVGDLPLVMAALAPRGLAGHRFRLGRRLRTEQACAADEYPVGPDRILRLRSGRAAIELTPDALLVYCGQRLALRAPRPLLVAAAGPHARLAIRPRLGGDGPAVTRTLVSTPGRLRLGRASRQAVERLTAAFELVQAAWPEGADEVRRFTEAIVPLDEPGTVSYSLLARPGYSYINLAGKSRVELADDLTHETAHHILHAVEEIAVLVDPDDEAVAEPAWWSPWRRAWRPLRGIVHACYTFTVGAHLFARLGGMAGPASRRGPVLRLSAGQRRFAARRLLEETVSLRFSLADLTTAAAAGQLTNAGIAVTGQMVEQHRREIAPAARRARTWLRDSGPAGMRELARVARLEVALRQARHSVPAHWNG